MIRFTLICLVSRVLGEIQSMEHSVYMSRKSRSNSLPTHSGYVYSRSKNHPGSVSEFEYNSDSSLPSAKYGMTSENNFEPPNFEYADPEMSRTYFKREIEVTDPPINNYNIDAAIDKAEAKYNSKFLPSKMRTDAMYERLRSVMHYHPPDSTLEAPLGYDIHDYHLDDEDVRTSSRGLYDSWPYFYHSPYEYEYMKFDSEIEKMKDKLYGTDSVSVIPIYENVNDIPNLDEYNIIPSHLKTTTNNPILGNMPLFYSIPNKYFHENDFDDPLTLKAIEWGTEFDYHPITSDIEEYRKKKRQDLQNLPNKSKISPSSNSQNLVNYKSNKVLDNDNAYSNYGELNRENTHEKKNDYDIFEKGKDNTKNHKTAYGYDGKFYKRFKDFADSFANKFGGEDHKKDSKYVLKMNHDKGEKKKGFRRLYHKDEYQEDNEFYDNNNSSAKAEESGSSKAHIGGSEAVVQSHTVTAASDEGSALNKAGSDKDKLFENNRIGHGFRKDTDNQLIRYRDVAKKAAQSNTTDYTDHYRI